METSFVTKTRRHLKETQSVKDLNRRLDFLQSRVNAQSDPTIQALIRRTKDAISALYKQHGSKAGWLNPDGELPEERR